MDSETLMIIGFSAPIIMLLLAAPAMLGSDTELRTLARLGLALLVLGLVGAFLVAGIINF